MKESRKIAEGLAPLETVIFLDSEGAQRPSIFSAFCFRAAISSAFETLFAEEKNLFRRFCRLNPVFRFPRPFLF